MQRRSKTTKRKAQLPPDNSGLTGREGDLLHKIEREIIRLQSFAVRLSRVRLSHSLPDSLPDSLTDSLTD